MLFIIREQGTEPICVGQDVMSCEYRKTETINEYFPKIDYEEAWNIEVRNLNRDVIEVLLGTGLFYDINQERFYGIFPGGLKTGKFDFMASVLDEKFYNKIYLGVGLRCFNGIHWADIASGECSQLELEFFKEWSEVDWKRMERLK